MEKRPAGRTSPPGYTAHLSFPDPQRSPQC